jgi:RND family efflux transporter MFP subunit
LRKYRKAGDAVGKGTVIAQLENDVLRENLRIAETDLAKTQKDVERYQNLSASGAVTAMELETAQIALRSTESRIAELKDQLANTTIVSPTAGIIDKDYFEEGTLFAAGSPVVDIVDDKSLKMKISVTEKEILKLKKGNKAFITTDIYPEKTFPGTIAVVAPKGNTLYSYAVEVNLERNADLKPGMYATASFNEDGNTAKAIVINRKAIVGGIKAPYIFVVRDNKACKVAVQLGHVNNNLVEVVQGIFVDDVVVISGQVNLREGVEVAVI